MSSGCPISGQSPTSRAMRDASAFIASSVVSYDIAADGNAHILPIVIDAKPQAVCPFRVVTRQ